MSAQAAKVLRRDLRRAVGAEAIGVIDHNAQIVAALQRQVQALEQVQLHHARSISAFVRTHASQTAHLAAHDRVLVRPTVWGRLRWLVTGT